MTEYDAHLRCSCGEEHDYEASTQRITCGCGAIYAVAITQIRPMRA